MATKYVVGQKVILTPVGEKASSPRDSALEPYAGQVGKITNYYWISPGGGTEAFYIYTVQIGTGNKEVVLHEDEMKSCLE